MGSEEEGMAPTHRKVTTLAIAAFFVCFVLLWPSAAQEEIEIVASVAFTEGPTVDREGNVYFTEIMSQRILKLGIDGVVSTYREHSNAANGLLIDPQGRLVACEGAEFRRGGAAVSGKPRVTRTDLRTGKLEVLAESGSGVSLQGPNDVTIDGKGRLYFTDMAGAAVYRIDALGKVAPHPRCTRHSAPQWDPGFTGRQDALPRRSQRSAGRCSHDPGLRSATRRYGPQHARPLQLLPRTKRRRHEH
jgi:hypothetical protein